MIKKHKDVYKVNILGTNKNVNSTKSLNYIVGQASSPDHLSPKLVF